jgi:hypothetical protein
MTGAALPPDARSSAIAADTGSVANSGRVVRISSSIRLSPGLVMLPSAGL